MANEYYERLSEMNPGDLADGLAMEAEFDAISQGFSKLPTPHTGGQGFDGPVRVGDAVNTDEAVSLGQLNAAIGEAVLLPIATYGDLSATAWGALPSNTYLLFGTGAQFANTPYTLVAGSTYYLQVRHVIGGSGVAIYHDQLSLASTDDSANVDLRRLFVRTGGTFASAVSGGWVGFTLKKAALTALESLSPSADQLAYYTSAGAAAMTPLTPFARSLLDDTDGAAARNTLFAFKYDPSQLSIDINYIVTAGVYNIGGTSANWPHSSGGTLIVTSHGTYINQQAHLGAGGQMLIRGYDAGASTWSPWRFIHDQRSVVGVVSQSSGIPTGAIIERGSNANGEYVKYADGTLICTKNGIPGTLANTGNINANIFTPVQFVYLDGISTQVGFTDLMTDFPRVFSGPTAYNITADSPTISTYIPIAILSNNTFTQANANVCRFGYIAIGRWF
ncbi:pyocin knob domain-containing protein [Aeromonas sp. ASNIH2]|uniref:pyocin knob domain-containing protein n=1 Tax=Aeromonas sp. ASNIH2 TaxID=1636607 RepID=UPI000CDC9D10|nr:pyocin knob domain-containing protein [Aeromonas sp. ASNIH2]AUY11167.1 hypothetical protein C3F36_17920 [Aeromonas sp. ASNIH2]